jgi:HEAT repeat protein
MGDAGTEALGRILSGGTTTDERRIAAELLGRLGDPRAVSMLQDVLDKDSDVLLRRAAAASMRRLAAPESAPYMEALLRNGGEDRYVRMSAAYGLAQLGKREGVSGLSMIFDEAHADGRGREQAFRALRSLNDERSLPFMRDVAASAAEPTYRLQAIRFLTAQADRQSLDALQRIMTSPSEQPSVRDAAAKAYHAIQSK